MFLRWLAVGCICLIVSVGTSQDATEAEDNPKESSGLVDRLFEMAEHDSVQEVRRIALGACATMPDQQSRFAATIDRMLDSSDRATRFDAVLHLDSVDLPAEREVAAAIRHLRDLYAEGKTLFREPDVLPALRAHPEVALGMIVEHLQNDGDFPLLYWDLADKCGLDVEEYPSLLVKYSQSQDAEVRQRVARLISQRLQVKQARRKRANEQRSAEGNGGTIPERYYDYAKRVIARYDRDDSGSLQAAEWETMLISPVPADANHDGEITAREYADYLIKRSNR
ncbi:hypothetical protein [Roseimaritima sediminicola]|uniref:hypothetical protein n=1 Tax=Roseimaritima sediminicola TaxID=2662066 RepID=UPI001298355F|nr:hypothetical protein [Roseimaritima sediminicola]